MKRRRFRHVRRGKRASTTDVLGRAPAATKRRRLQARGKWGSHCLRLLELREQLLNKQASLTRAAIEEEPTFSLHMADAGTDSYDRDFALGMLSAEQDALYEIDQALDRIRNGTYGSCELTGHPIEPERLEAIPWTRYTVAAEKQLEIQGRAVRAGLGPRDTVVKTDTRSEPPENA